MRSRAPARIARPRRAQSSLALLELYAAVPTQLGAALEVADVLLQMHDEHKGAPHFGDDGADAPVEVLRAVYKLVGMHGLKVGARARRAARAGRARAPCPTRLTACAAARTCALAPGPARAAAQAVRAAQKGIGKAHAAVENALHEIEEWRVDGFDR